MAHPPTSTKRKPTKAIELLSRLLGIEDKSVKFRKLWHEDVKEVSLHRDAKQVFLGCYLLTSQFRYQAKYCKLFLKLLEMGIEEKEKLKEQEGAQATQIGQQVPQQTNFLSLQCLVNILARVKVRISECVIHIQGEQLRALANVRNRALTLYMKMLNVSLEAKRMPRDLLKFAYHAYLSRYMFSGDCVGRIAELEDLLLKVYDKTRFVLPPKI